MMFRSPFDKEATLYWSILLLNAALFMVWPLAHTIALRKLLLLLAAIAGIALLVKADYRKQIINQSWLQWMMALLAWVAFHAAFLSQNGNDAWREFLGQWLPPYIAMFAGIGVALASRQVHVTHFNRLLLFCALALPVYYLLENLVKWEQVGYLPIGYMKPGEPNFVLAGTDLKTSLTESLEWLLAFAAARMLERWRDGRTDWRWVTVYALGVMVVYVSGIKNLAILLVLNMLLIALIEGWRRGVLRWQRIMMAVVALLLVAVVAIQQSSSISKIWQRAKEDTQIAVDIDRYQHWKNFTQRGLPQNSLGETLSETYYLRVAYARAAWRDMWANPLGYGVSRKAMERLEQQRDATVSLSHAHNSFLNLALAVGLPGLILFGAAMAAALRQLHQARSGWARPAQWVIVFYLLHWLLDALERDHFFEMFLYGVALLTGLALLDDKRNDNTET